MHLVRPETNSHYGFASYKPQDLYLLLDKRITLNTDDVNSLAKLWTYYQKNDVKSMLEIGQSLKKKMSFVLDAIYAYEASFPKPDYEGRPIESLKSIISELGTIRFGPVFKEFCQREAIYGYGDLQVKRLYDQILKK